MSQEEQVNKACANDLNSFKIKHSLNILTMNNAPNKNMKTKSDVRSRKDPSSRIWQCRYVKIMLNRKVKPSEPKKQNDVISLHHYN
jgi:hypothetical protein